MNQKDAETKKMNELLDVRFKSKNNNIKTPKYVKNSKSLSKKFKKSHVKGF